jgi:hypothetical protein
MSMQRMSRFLDGWILILGGLGIGLVLWLAPAAGANARNEESLSKRDFDHLVRAVEGRYQMHGKSVPMMWIANLCAKGFTHGGVQGMKIVEFEDAYRIANAGGEPGEFDQLVKSQLGERWSPMVGQHDKNGGNSYVYVRSSEDSKLTRMIVVDLYGAELDMVALTLNPDQLAKWMKEHDSDSAKQTSSDSGASE